MQTKQKNKTRSPFIWEKVHFVGKITLDWEHPRVYRYMPFSKAQEIINESEIMFVSPQNWDDPYEKRYYKVKVNGKQKSMPSLACLCLTTSQSENAFAFWNWRKGSDEPWVRLEFDLYELLRILDDYAKRNKTEIFVSSIDYSYNEKEIKTIHRSPDFGAEDKIHYYVKLMSLKRKAYCYENEIRIFIVLKRGAKKFDEDKILKIEFKNNSSLPKLVNKITLDPHFSELEKIPAAYDLNLLQYGSKLNYEKQSKNLLNRSHLKIRLENSQLFRCNKCEGITFPKKLRSH